MERIPESMFDDDIENLSPDSRQSRAFSAAVSERRHSRSPQSPCRMSGTPTVRTRTPSGSVIYNPFQRDVMRKLGGFTCSPGTFNTPPTRHNEGTQPFAWSPNVKGDLFPEDIDEHPTTQFQLQERLNSQYDEEAQSFIGSFFNSQLVVPSPAESSSTHNSENLRRLAIMSGVESPMPRSSTANEVRWTTPTGRKPQASKTVTTIEADVEVQTDLSMSPSFDITAFLPPEVWRRPGGSVSRGEPFSTQRIFNCESCHAQKQAGNRMVRRSLFTPPRDGEAVQLGKSVQDMLRDFNASSPETCASNEPRFNSSFEGDRFASPDISPIGSPNKTLNNEEEDDDKGDDGDDTFNMDTGYQSHVLD